MALSPKWSEEARKNRKETNIDDRMHERALCQKERIESEREKMENVDPMPKVPAYAEASLRMEPDQKEEKSLAPAINANEICQRIMESVSVAVRNEVQKLVNEGRLNL